MTEYLPRDAAARYLSSRGIPVKTGTLAHWACNQRYALPYIKIGRIVRYAVADLDRFVEQHRVCPIAEEK